MENRLYVTGYALVVVSRFNNAAFWQDHRCLNDLVLRERGKKRRQNATVYLFKMVG
jgi:hypothetical protein